MAWYCCHIISYSYSHVLCCKKVDPHALRYANFMANANVDLGLVLVGLG